ncbi:MAG: TlyA family RNA methyltransferase [Actinomycetia bacterium]|nr:TlyA family RNA methyltransferase [Actinomycetes bacterium]
MSTEKLRLDELLVRRGWFADVAAAGRAIYAGTVSSPQQVNLKPGQLVPADLELQRKPEKTYVSRGGEKLAAALATFQLDVRGLNCLDLGASSGGFTDCLLQQGAATVTAVDVGYGQFAWRLRSDPRVRLLERTNFRILQPADLVVDGPSAGPLAISAFDLVVADLSFIRTSALLAHIRHFLVPTGQTVILIKPQFELPVDLANSPTFLGGVVRDPAWQELVLTNFLAAAQAAGFVARGLMASPLLGPDGNREFLFWATLRGIPATMDIPSLVGRN